ncbi:MAG: NAD(P)H-binding protein [Polyangiaceae bacterium]
MSEKRILVVGASQGTGALVVKAAIARGMRVTAFARSPEKLRLEHTFLDKRVGDFHDAASVAGVVPGHDAVIVTASATSFKTLRETKDFFSRGTRYVIDAMKASGVKRIVILSALGVGESRPLVNFVARKLLVDGLLKAAFQDHAVQEEMVMQSGLEWVVARPGRLTDEPGKKTYVKIPAIEKVPNAISRADVADFLLEGATTDEWVGKAVQIGG